MPPPRTGSVEPLKRAALAVAPVMVSDRTSVIVLGVPWRSLRAFCQERGIPIGRIGRRPVVSVAKVVAAFEGAGAPPRTPWNEDEVIAAAARKGA